MTIVLLGMAAPSEEVVQRNESAAKTFYVAIDSAAVSTPRAVEKASARHRHLHPDQPTYLG